MYKCSDDNGNTRKPRMYYYNIDAAVVLYSMKFVKCRQRYWYSGEIRKITVFP